MELDPLFRYNIEARASATGEVLEQPFCLVITIRDPEREAPVYNEVIHQLDVNNFLHKPVRVRSQVRNLISG